MERVVVLGTSGSGKTTVARELAGLLDLPYLELDSIFHQDGWGATPGHVFQDQVRAFVSAPRWVVDGNYTSHGMREVLWPSADTFVWLDLPRRAVMRRVVTRTLRRVITREELWDGVTEPWSNLYSTDPEKNIMVWAWTTFEHNRAKYEMRMEDGSWSHAEVHRLVSPRDVDRFLSSARQTRPDHG